MADTNSGGGGGTDMTETNAKLEEIAKALSGDEKTIVKDVAIRLFSNTEFNISGISAQQAANNAVERALVLVSKLKQYKYIE